jgi:hypothetical protein
MLQLIYFQLGFASEAPTFGLAHASHKNDRRFCALALHEVQARHYPRGNSSSFAVPATSPIFFVEYSVPSQRKIDSTLSITV